MKKGQPSDARRDQTSVYAHQRRMEGLFKDMEIIRFRRLAAWLMEGGVDCQGILAELESEKGKRRTR